MRNNLPKCFCAIVAFCFLTPQMLIAQSGYVSVSAGVTVDPSTAVLGESFTVRFTLRETAGQSITFEHVAVAILRENNAHVFDLAMYDNVSFQANETKSWVPNGQIYCGGENRTGTYKVVIRGRVAGGEWFDFSTVADGINPRSFPVTCDGNVGDTDVDPCASSAGISCARMQLNICPAGDFEYIGDGCLPLGAQYIWVIARNSCCEPITNIPWTDYWLGSCDPSLGLFMCVSPISADSLTGENGRTTFSMRVAGGGCNIPAGSLTGQGIWLAVQGRILEAKPCLGSHLCLPVEIKSPDLARNYYGFSDGRVNLADFAFLMNSYHTAWGVSPPSGRSFNACCDFNDDNRVDLVDFAIFSDHYLHQCQ